jgi:predicted transcriptional regulator
MKKLPKKRTFLNTHDVVRLVKEWETKTMSEWAAEYNISYQSMSKMVNEIRVQDATLCPKQSKKRRSRTSIVTEALSILKKS